MPSARSARLAILLLFLFHGILLGGWVTHIPLAKERLDVGPGIFGAALLSFAAGAVIAMPIAGALINKFGSARVCWITGLMFALFLFAPTLAPTIFTFLIGGMLLGASVGSMDVAMNAHGIAVEKALKRPVISGFHGMFSLGAAIGTLGGAWWMGEVGPLWQLISIGLVGAAGIAACIPMLLPAEVDKGLSGRNFAMPTRATIGLGILCFLALMVEGSVADWAAIMLQESFLVEASIAAYAFGFYQAGMAIARFSGDALRLRFGAVRLVAASSLLAAVGTAAALFFPSLWGSMAAFFVAGIGIGNVAPVLFAGGGRLEPEAPGRGIAVVTSLGYAGFLVGPPLLGIVAEVSTLQLSLCLTVIAALIIALFARMVQTADT